MAGSKSDSNRWSRYAVLDAKLRRLAEALSPPPEWDVVLGYLGDESTEEERLAVYQAVRDSCLLPEAAGWFLISSLVDEIAARDAEPVLGDYERQIETIEDREYRLRQGDIWPAGAAPAGYDVLRREYHQAWDWWFAQTLRKFGEHAMAGTAETLPDEFEALVEAGRQFFFGPETVAEIAPLVWIRDLLVQIAACIEVQGPTGPLGCRFQSRRGRWQVHVYPTPVELVGGAVDGRIVPRCSPSTCKSCWPSSTAQLPCAGRPCRRRPRTQPHTPRSPRTGQPVRRGPLRGSPAGDRRPGHGRLGR